MDNLTLKNYLVELIRPDDTIDMIIRQPNTPIETLKNLAVMLLENSKTKLRRAKRVFSGGEFIKSINGGDIRETVFEIKAQNYIAEQEELKNIELIKSSGIVAMPKPQTNKEKIAKLGGIKLKSLLSERQRLLKLGGIKSRFENE